MLSSLKYKEDDVSKNRVKKRTLKKRREHHVQKRRVERFGIFLTRKDLEQIIRIIKEGNAILLGVESHSKKHYKVEYAGLEMKVVYSKTHECLLTVIPLKNQHEKAA
jgi:hypothetical protein